MNAVASIFFALALIPVASAELLAQTGGKFAAGANVTTKLSPRPDSRGSTGIGLLWRVGHGRQGWGWKYGLNWYSAELDRTVGAQHLEFGELNIRPLMGGYGYTQVIRGAKVSANFLAGPAFTSFSPRQNFATAYMTANRVNAVDVEASSTWVAKPEVSAWFDVARKVGVNVSVGYMFARPDVTLTSPIERETRRTTADVVLIKVGAVYSIF